MRKGGFFCEKESAAWHPVPEWQCAYGNGTVVVDDFRTLRREGMENHVEGQSPAEELELGSHEAFQVVSGTVDVQRCHPSEK